MIYLLNIWWFSKYSCVRLASVFAGKTGYPLSYMERHRHIAISYQLLQGEGRDALRASQGQLRQALAVEGAAKPIGAGLGALQRLGESYENG